MMGKQMQTTKEGKAIILPDSTKLKLWPSLSITLMFAKNGPKVPKESIVIRQNAQKDQ